MVSVESKVDVPAIVTAGRTSALALAAYREDRTSPERFWNFQEAHWDLNRFAMGLPKSDVAVSDVPWTKDKMGLFMRKRRFGKAFYPNFALFLPEIASTAEGLKLLAKAYPQMGWSEQDINGVQNVDQSGNPLTLFGHLMVESSIDAPCTRMNEDQAREAVRKAVRIPQTLNVYAEAGHVSKLLSPTFQYLDEDRTTVRILSSRVVGRVVYAYFGPDGGCLVHWNLRPDYAVGRLGVRSVGA